MSRQQNNVLARDATEEGVQMNRVAVMAAEVARAQRELCA